MLENFKDVASKIDSLDIKGPNIKDLKSQKFNGLNYEPIYKNEKETPELNSFLPKTDGRWEGERGNSIWIPEVDKVPIGKGSNIDGKSWGEILFKYGIDGINFIEGEPDFTEVSKGTVKIGDFTESRDKNFMQADQKLAEERKCTPGEIRKWRQENGYTWHERSDCETMDLVPSEIHNNVPHSGGISEKKKQNV
ncbi:MAG: HNH endonuclease [Cetobacterium sp.]|uniref:HNH endonuclease n=1 Tax=Cetobacterium sp. TaxID=2071632 RepID=UPI003EE586CA